MAEVVLDANVIVALLDAADSQHARAVELTERLEAEGHDLVLVDFLVFEALSVLCRRAAQRNWFDNGEVRFLARERERLACFMGTMRCSDPVALPSLLRLSRRSEVLPPPRSRATATETTFQHANCGQVETIKRLLTAHCWFCGSF
jgi:predicted nucleic acid-binding protein